MKVKPPLRRGVTLVELMVALAMISIGVLGVVGSYRYINIGIQSAKIRSLANNIAQERVEFLKNKSYYKILVTTNTASDGNFSPAMFYDTGYYPPENVNVGGINFIRRIRICKVNEKSDGQLDDCLSHAVPDTGIKLVQVMVVWQERGQWRKLELRNLRENPARVNQGATIRGRITDGVSGLPGVLVRAQESPSNLGETNATGDYSFNIEPGSYTLVASTAGYFTATIPKFYVSTDAIKNASLTRMFKGTISGGVYKRDHPVVYMIVGSSVMLNGDDVEFITLYNPTTAQIAVWDGSDNNLRLSYADENGAGNDIFEFFPQYISTVIPSGHFFTYASTGVFQFSGQTKYADAVFTAANQPPCLTTANGQMDCIKVDKAGSVRIKNLAYQTVDTVGWRNPATGKNPQYYETNPTQWWSPNGLERGGLFLRFNGPWSVDWDRGSCYDDNNNIQNIYYMGPAWGFWPPAMTLASGYRAPYACTPAAGGLVFANDGLSAPATIGAEGYFSLVNVATAASWTLFASSGVLYSSVTAPAGTTDGFSSSLSNFHIATATLFGYVSGRVTDINNVPLNNIKMYSAGVPQANTDASGRYTLPVYAGAVTVAANYLGQSAAYVELSSVIASVAYGELKQNVNFSLYNGGKIRGRITANGTDPLPNVPVVGLKNGVEQGSAVSGSDGYFLISGYGISTGTYLVVPQLESGESATPSSTTVNVTAGNTVFSTTFTVSGAAGYITGTVRTGSAAGPVINTGVLVYVTTSTLAGAPPTINGALRSGVAANYAASANARGEYSIAVKGGFSYNVYAWYTNWTGSTPNTVRKSSTTISVGPNQTRTVNFFW
jgi:prepilin-type N-terminal cleavage/methylation domain-containing protein